MPNNFSPLCTCVKCFFTNYNVFALYIFRSLALLFFMLTQQINLAQSKRVSYNMVLWFTPFLLLLASTLLTFFDFAFCVLLHFKTTNWERLEKYNQVYLKINCYELLIPNLESFVKIKVDVFKTWAIKYEKREQ